MGGLGGWAQRAVGALPARLGLRGAGSSRRVGVTRWEVQQAPTATSPVWAECTVCSQAEH